MNLRLQTPALWLDPPVAADEAFYIALYTDPATMRHVGAAQSPDAARRGFHAACRLDAQSPPRRRFWVLRGKQEGTPVGLLGLHLDDEGGAEVGAVIAPGEQGRGHATAAIAALADHAFADLGLRRLHTRHDDSHGLAAGLMATLGFHRLGAEAGIAGWTWELTPARWRERATAGDSVAALR